MHAFVINIIELYRNQKTEMVIKLHELHQFFRVLYLIQHMHSLIKTIGKGS